jgi:acyl-CoA thioesterase
MWGQIYKYFHKVSTFRKKNLKNMELPARVVAQMMDNDHFSKWLGIKVLEIRKGFCELEMVVRREMLNGFGIAHGGIAFSLADSALAFASNSHNIKSLVLDASVSFTAPVREGDLLKASAEEINTTRRTGVYLIQITSQGKNLVMVFKGTVFRKEERWFPDEE